MLFIIGIKTGFLWLLKCIALTFFYPFQKCNSMQKQQISLQMFFSFYVIVFQPFFSYFLVLKSRDTNVIDCKCIYQVSLPDQSSTQMYCTGYLLSSSEMECNSNNLYFLLQVFLSFHLILFKPLFFPLLTFTFYERYCLYGTLHTRRTLLLTVHPIFQLSNFELSYFCIHAPETLFHHQRPYLTPTLDEIYMKP